MSKLNTLLTAEHIGDHEYTALCNVGCRSMTKTTCTECYWATSPSQTDVCDAAEDAIETPAHLYSAIGLLHV